MHRALGILGGVGLGAGFMYFFDPQLGRRRRIRAADQLGRMIRDAECQLEVAARDAANRSRGLLAEARSAVAGRKPPDDRTLAERVRSRMGHLVSHPRAVHVVAAKGKVTLSGAILADEVDSLLAAVGDIHGVVRVENRLEAHRNAGTHPALQGGSTPCRGRGMFQGTWPPALRMIAGTVGVGLMGNCLAKRDTVSVLLGTAGFGLFLRATSGGPRSDRVRLRLQSSNGARMSAPARPSSAAAPGRTRPTAGRK